MVFRDEKVYNGSRARLAMRGKFLLIDGLDGIGKGVFLRAMKKVAMADGKRILDLHDYWRANGHHPSFDDFKKIDLIFSSEPTFVHAGKLIREEMIRDDTEYSALAVAQAYALDRQVLYDVVLKPALAAGIGIIQSRAVSTSLVYQPLDAARKGESLTLDDVRAIPGNAQALEKKWVPDMVVVPIVPSAAVVMDRLEQREKQDQATFETIEFQERAKKEFEAAWFKELFEKLGARVEFPNAGISIEHSEREAVRLYRELF